MKSKVNLIFRLKNLLFRRRAILHYKEAMKNTRLDKTSLDILNWEKRKAIVEHAYNNIPFYKEYYDSVGFSPDMLVSELDWNNVPVLEKSMIRQNIERLLDPNVKAKDIAIATTGGSTGTPLKVYTDKRFHFEVLGWRAFSWWKVSPASHVGIIHRRVPVSIMSKFFNRILWWPTRRIYLHASSITDKELKKFVNDISKNKISWLQGYVGGLERVASYIQENNLKINCLKLVWSTSAPLYPNVRKKLENAFGCKVMNQYGCCEIPNIAIQCPMGEGLHINSDYVHVDIVNKDDSPCFIDQEGDMLVSNLYGYAFPLIKYRLGDRGTLLGERCKCRCNLPLLGEIKGRISDSIYTPDGLYVDGSYLTTIFDNYTSLVDQFQVYQYMDYSVTVFIKPINPDVDMSSIVSMIEQQIKKNVQNKIPVNIELVNRIKDDKGKIRYVISEVALAKI